METVVSKEEEEEAVVVENGRKMKMKKRCTWLQTRRKKWRRSKRWHTASAGGMGVRVGGKVREERVEDGEESAVVVVAKGGRGYGSLGGRRPGETCALLANVGC